MNELLGRVFGFEKHEFPNRSTLYNKLATDGQSPKALMISCADSRVVPEHIMQAEPGDLFVCRNAGNIVPPYSQVNGGVSSTVEYAVVALGVRDIIVCGHSDCGAMKGLAHPEALDKMPIVASWLKHGKAAAEIVADCYPGLNPLDKVRAIAMENVAAQLAHLRTHPSVAAGIARGQIALHGWFVDIHAGNIMALDGQTGRFVTLKEDQPLPIAVAQSARHAYDVPMLEAAE